jgi:hypothetical protein
MKILLHIEHLVLDGIAVGPGQQAQLKAACEVRLAQLLHQGGIAPDLRPGSAHGNTPPAPAIHLAGTLEPARLGQGIAQAVYGSIRP